MNPPPAPHPQPAPNLPEHRIGQRGGAAGGGQTRSLPGSRTRPSEVGGPWARHSHSLSLGAPCAHGRDHRVPRHTSPSRPVLQSSTLPTPSQCPLAGLPLKPHSSGHLGSKDLAGAGAANHGLPFAGLDLTLTLPPAPIPCPRQALLPQQHRPEFGGGDCERQSQRGPGMPRHCLLGGPGGTEMDKERMGLEGLPQWGGWSGKAGGQGWTSHGELGRAFLAQAQAQGRGVGGGGRSGVSSQCSHQLLPP